MAQLSQTPAMGWNSWNTFAANISEDLVKESAQAFADHGLTKAGYNYLVLDDCWSLRKRDANGKLVADPEKFPNGMKALADHIHAQKLKLGIYSCAGIMTCAGFPGSFEHEFEDAATFAEWGIDYLKYDYCDRPQNMDGKLLYRRMAMALRNCGRDILFSACNWGHHEVETWIRSTGAHSWRSTGDIVDNWASMRDIALSQFNKGETSAPYCFNDLDMMTIGMYGEGHSAMGGQNDVEYRTQFSIWCLMQSPLMIGCDVRKLSDAAREILTNDELIAINQDIEGRAPYVLHQWDSPWGHTMIKPLSDGSYALGFFNFNDAEGNVNASIQFWDMGLPTAAGYGFKLRDLWAHEDIGIETEGMRVWVPSHGCKIYRAELVKV